MHNTGTEQKVFVPGLREFRLGRLTLKVLRAFQQFVAERIGDPFEHVERWLGRVPESETVRMLRAAEDVRDQLRFFSLAAPIAQQALAADDGGVKLIHLLMEQVDPKATEEDALAVALHLASAGKLAEVITRAQGGGGGGQGNAQPPAAGRESAGAT
jgi:hypothetical protein